MDRARNWRERSSDWAEWLSAGYVDEALTPPAMARLPVYSTWYSFTQDIDAETVLAESRLATDLGCGAMFIDDGWQRFGHGRGYQGCGDWIPDESKFADLPATVKQIQGMGAAVGLWIAPLLLGRQSEAVRELSGFAPQWDPLLACQVLDPRHPEVRDYVEQTCLRLVTDYGVDLLKIDFLDRAMIYQGTVGDGDLADIGQAMARMLQGVRRRLAAAGRDDVAFEFRQPYVSPAIAAYGEILRANDCPGDSVVNRVCTLDARMLSAGRVVHADPMMWGIAGGAEAVAQQLYGAWFAVPQISMRLAELQPGADRCVARAARAVAQRGRGDPRRHAGGARRRTWLRPGAGGSSRPGPQCGCPVQPAGGRSEQQPDHLHHRAQRDGGPSGRGPDRPADHRRGDPFRGRRRGGRGERARPRAGRDRGAGIRKRHPPAIGVLTVPGRRRS